MGQTELDAGLPRDGLGGFVTATAGIIAKFFGLVIGGVFLRFPAFLPAGAILIEQYEKRRKACTSRCGHGSLQLLTKL